MNALNNKSMNESIKTVKKKVVSPFLQREDEQNIYQEDKQEDKPHCYHCSEPILTGDNFWVEIFGVKQALCCPGCEAIAHTIVENGLTSYYQYRTTSANKQSLISERRLVPECLQSLAQYDHAELQDDFVHLEKGINEVVLSVTGMSCAACAWLIEKQVRAQKGVCFMGVNSTTNRATLRWDVKKNKLSHLLYEITKLGYHAVPFEIDNHEEKYHHIMKEYLKKIGIAGLATMQVMMLAIAMYFDVGDTTGTSVIGDDSFRVFFRWVSLIFATPVLLYSATPFYNNAWRNIKTKTLGMDVPVSIALLFSYFASVYATVTGVGEVYFESIAMFTFFLLIGRFLEMRAKRTCAAQSANLLTLIPRLARLYSKNHSTDLTDHSIKHLTQKCSVHSLCIGDCVLVLPGEAYPADGVIRKGKTTIDESMLTGESMPISKKEHDRVYAGTLNMEGHVRVEVTAKKKDAWLNQIIRLQESAQSVKPRVAEISERVSRYFVGLILFLSAVTWMYWHAHRPEDAFWIMLSVLVATCPCALSLATPTAITCAITKCNQWGVLFRTGHVFETLTQINHVIFDKTGTLTQGKMSIVHTQIYPPSSQNSLSKNPTKNKASQNTLSKKQAQSIASALESFAHHPIAHAFKIFKPDPEVTEVENVIGEGLKGMYQGEQWRIGKPEFALVNPKEATHAEHSIWLSRNGEKVASFQLSDPLRPSASVFIEKLKQAGVKITMLTGDNANAAYGVAQSLGITRVYSRVSPQGKWDYLHSRPQDEIIMMIGDGINDTPVLAGAHLSVAMGAGVDAAKSAADMVLLRDDLSVLIHAKKWAHFTQKIIRQNMAWALGYNVTILPLAMMGLIPPYIAVVGMSASSLIVVANSLRLLGKNNI